MDGMATRCKSLYTVNLTRPHSVHTVRTVHPYLVILFQIDTQIEVCPLGTDVDVHTIVESKYGRIDPPPLFCYTANHAFDLIGKQVIDAISRGIIKF